MLEVERFDLLLLFKYSVIKQYQFEIMLR